MEENKFFRYVWRFNAIAIALVGVLAIILLTAGLIDVFDLFDGPRSGAVKAGEGQDALADLEFGSMERISGHPHIMLPLQQVEGAGSSSYAYSLVKNYLFIEPSKGGQHWLYHHNQFLILGLYRATAELPGGKEEVRSLIYRVVQADTDGDGMLTSADEKIIALTAPDGSGYSEPLTNVDEVLDSHVTDDGVLALIYRRGSDKYLARILPDGPVIETKLVMQRKPVRSK